jgi:hypothetical protein
MFLHSLHGQSEVDGVIYAIVPREEFKSEHGGFPGRDYILNIGL